MRNIINSRIARQLRKHGASLLLMALAGGAWAYLVRVDAHRPSDEDIAARRFNVFPVFHRDAVTFLEIMTDTEVIRLRRSGSAEQEGRYWRMDSPVKEVADPAVVDDLLQDFDFARGVRRVEEGGGLGLDQPRIHGTLVTGDITYRFALGGKAPIPLDAAYFRLDGVGIWVVTPEFARKLTRGSESYRDKMLRGPG